MSRNASILAIVAAGGWCVWAGGMPPPPGFGPAQEVRVLLCAAWPRRAASAQVKGLSYRSGVECAHREGGRAGTTPMSANTSFAEAWGQVDTLNQMRQAVRLVPTGEPVDDEARGLRGIRKYLDEWDIPVERLAHVLKVGPTVVCALLCESAIIPAAERHTLVRKALEWTHADARDRDLRRARFVATPVTRLTLNVARAVRVTRTVGLLTGPAGLGKTFALGLVAAELPATLIVRAGPDSRGARGVLRVIGAAASGPTATAPGIKSGIQAARQSHGLIVIDEAHALSMSALEAARAVFDEAEVGLLLIGTSVLGRHLSDECDDPMVGPLATRIALRCDLGAELLGRGPDGRPRPWLGLAELRAIVERQGGSKLDRDAARTLYEVANYWRGYLRTVVNAVRVARLLAGDEKRTEGETVLTGEHVADALRLAGKTATAS